MMKGFSISLSVSSIESNAPHWQRKAEQLAKQLSDLSQDLAVYNEFADRTRLGDSVNEIREDLEALQQDNEQLQSKLETVYSEKKVKEEQISSKEAEIEKIKTYWNAIRSQFNAEDRHE